MRWRIITDSKSMLKFVFEDDFHDMTFVQWGASGMKPGYVYVLKGYSRFPITDCPKNWYPV